MNGETIDPKEVGAMLSGYTEETLDQLLAFGVPLLAETTGRTALLDQKSVAIMGWSSALLAFMLFTGAKETVGSPARSRFASPQSSPRGRWLSLFSPCE